MEAARAQQMGQPAPSQPESSAAAETRAAQVAEAVRLAAQIRVPDDLAGGSSVSGDADDRAPPPGDSVAADDDDDDDSDSGRSVETIAAQQTAIASKRRSKLRQQA